MQTTPTKKILTTMKATINPADHNLTSVQSEVYSIVRDRHIAKLITTRSDIETALGGKDKSWICRILKSLTKKGLIERYQQRYYKLKGK